MKISKIARKFGILKSILKYGTWEILTNIDSTDECAGANIGDLYITDITTKQAEEIILLDNFFAMQSSAGYYYYLHPIENYKIDSIIGKLLKNIKKLEKISKSNIDISEDHRNEIKRIINLLIDISPDL